MAKVKVRAKPGALSDLLKRKAMTQVDAAEATRVDRKTLAKIERGEEVKRETLQKLANGLRVPLSFFEPPELTEPSVIKLEKDDERGLIMLRELDAEGLAALLTTADRVHWHLNLQIVDDEVRRLLEEYEQAVQQLHEYLKFECIEFKGSVPSSLRLQLAGLKKAQVVATLMGRLAEHRIAILGAEYLRWDVSKLEELIPQWENSKHQWCDVHMYKSTQIVELSIEKYGARTRREPVFMGSEPPKVTPETDPPTMIVVDGEVIF